MTIIESLRAKLAQVGGDMSALAAAAAAENRALNGEEQGQFDTLDGEFKALEQSISSQERAEEIQARLAQPQARAVPMVADTAAAAAASATTIRPARSGATGGTPVAHGYEHHGFKMGFGEYLLKVREAKTSGRVDARLMVNSISTFGGETVGGDGGYLVPPQFTTGVMSLVTPEDSFLRAIQPVPTNSNLITVPTDEDPPWGTSGVTAARTAEGAAITQSKPAFKKVNVVMHNVKALVPVSNESLRDIPFLANYVQNKIGQKLRWKVENYVLNGTGQDEPLGILNAPGLLSITDAASTATVIGAQDLMTMKASCLPGPGCFWIVHPLVQPQIWGLKSDGTTGYPIYTTDARVSPDGALLGSGIYKSEAAKPLNTTGDVLYVCPDGYILAFEAGGPQNAVSLEFAFDQDACCFRSTLRMGGMPTLASKVLRADGTNYASNLIALTGSRS